MFKNTKTQQTWNNRKEAIKELGRKQYSKMLKDKEFEFYNY